MRDTTLEGKTVISSEDCFCVPLLYCRRTFGFSHSKYKEPHHEAWLSNILFPMKSTLKVTSHDNDSATLTAWRMKNHFFNFNLLQEALSKALKPAFHFYQRHPAFKTTTTNKHCVKLCWNATPQFCCHTTVFYNTVFSDTETAAPLKAHDYGIIWGKSGAEAADGAAFPTVKVSIKVPLPPV